MKILYSHRIQSRDGQSVHLEDLIAAFRRAGHEVLVVGPGAYAASRFGDSGGAAGALRRLLPAAIGELAELAYNLPAFWRLWRAVRTFRPDLIYERYNLFFLAGAWAARLCRCRYFVEVNSPLADERAQHGGLRLQAVARAGERAVWRAADRVFAVTRVLGDILVAEGAPADRITITPNGVDIGRFPEPDRAAAHTPVLGFIGFVRPWHGLDLIIDDMARDSTLPLDLVIAGTGPALPDLRARAAALGIENRVRFVGLVDREAVPALLAGIDIALQPASVAYASPLKLFEYMAAGCAIVAPDQPNIREVLTHERNALLVDPGDRAALWRAVRRLAADPALRGRLSRAARAEVLSHPYLWDENAARIIALATRS
ncbi:glycosyltransferase family 4 protein [Acidiphilium sp.]|uniref:glycosyltransferase family 4 protein n=1 Tax=Acidiphilium sp. TaxID=527 RepID=UPI002591221A|nr:glycosyltransferase family 4 protein [Acidiphilium sp.]